ncbi:MAG: hypothetical protein WBW71_11280 [Bacteroidota bacterium]
MDNPEQYLLQVLRRTQTGLQDSLLPYHATKLRHLVERLEQAANLKEELDRLQHVRGFIKVAFSMEWVMERVTQSEEDFSPDQFDADATLLSDKLFEAFLSEPFDAPSEPSVPPGPSDATSIDPPAEFVASPSGEPEPVLPPVAVDSTELSSQAQPEVITGPDAQALPTPEETPGLSDLLDQNLLLGFQRFTEIVSRIGDKDPSERKSVFDMLAMFAKSSTEVARAQGKKEVFEFFQSVIKFIQYVDSSGLDQDSRVADVMHDVGERLSKALVEPSNGAAMLLGIQQILEDAESLIKS